jgi:hypothetical protein
MISSFWGPVEGQIKMRETSWRWRRTIRNGIIRQWRK